MNLVVPATMREMDRRTIEDIGVPGAVLMDRAAGGAVDALIDYFSPAAGTSIGLICGTGNNGGDGLAMATMLANAGYKPHVVVLGERDKLSDDAGLYFDIAAQSMDNLDIAGDEEALEKWLQAVPHCQIWCDALLGTGLDRPVKGRYAKAIEFLNNQSAPVMAVDIPSGLDGHTGQVWGVATDAELTATFGFAKVGQCLDPARRLCGRLVTVDIGIPNLVCDQVGFDAIGLNRSWLARHLPTRPLDMHKGRAGKTLHIGGRPTTAGAIALSARGALVAGAGLITVATDRRSHTMIPTMTPEIMASGCFDFSAQTIDDDAFEPLLDRADTVIIGPGLGTDVTGQRIFRKVLAAEVDNLVVDADALNLAANHDDIANKLAETDASVVLTPHPGEMARLQQTDIADVLADPISAAKKLADTFGCVAVLKTAATVVADTEGRLAINRTGNQGMATGGMGDVLTGLIGAAFADFKDDAFCAACCGVVVHGLAGDGAADHTGFRGLTVSRLLDEVPAIWQSLSR